jgi:hypothetical protein
MIIDSHKPVPGGGQHAVAVVVFFIGNVFYFRKEAEVVKEIFGPDICTQVPGHCFRVLCVGIDLGSMEEIQVQGELVHGFEIKITVELVLGFGRQPQTRPRFSRGYLLKRPAFTCLEASVLKKHLNDYYRHVFKDYFAL